MEISALQKERAAYLPKLPMALRGAVKVKEGKPTHSVDNQDEIKKLFPNTYGLPLISFEPGEIMLRKRVNVGVILSGGQAPGGHNVVCGLYDALKATNSENVLYGFKGGPSGLIEDKYLIFDDEYINEFRNTGGFDIIGSGRTKLETEEQFEDLCNFVKEVQFDRLGCFAYSAEENTVAAKMDGQIDQEVKDKRAELVMQIQTGIMAQKQAAKVGQTVRVLCDGVDDESGLYLCRTAADAPEVDGNVCVSSEEPLYPGEFYDVLVEDSDLYDLYGTVAK